jgi:hypothetical protein
LPIDGDDVDAIMRFVTLPNNLAHHHQQEIMHSRPAGEITRATAMVVLATEIVQNITRATPTTASSLLNFIALGVRVPMAILNSDLFDEPPTMPTMWPPTFAAAQASLFSGWGAFFQPAQTLAEAAAELQALLEELNVTRVDGSRASVDVVIGGVTSSASGVTITSAVVDDHTNMMHDDKNTSSVNQDDNMLHADKNASVADHDNMMHDKSNKLVDVEDDDARMVKAQDYNAMAEGRLCFDIAEPLVYFCVWPEQSVQW